MSLVRGNIFLYSTVILGEHMSKRYTQEEKEYMAKMAIEIVEKLNGQYPSFKNYVWAAQHILKGGEINNSTDQLIFDIINKKI